MQGFILHTSRSRTFVTFFYLLILYWGNLGEQPSFPCNFIVSVRHILRERLYFKFSLGSQKSFDKF